VAELTVAIAGLRTALLTSDPEIAAVIQARYKSFLSPHSPHWRIEMTARGAAATLTSSEDVEVRQEGGSRRFTVRRTDLTGSLDLGERRGHVSLVAGEIAIESFLRIAYSLAFVAENALLVHSSCLVRNSRAYLFCGPSGSGKTTVARLSTDAIVLTDELPVLRAANGRATAWGTPFWGELAYGAEDRSAPLVGIYFLHHGSRHAVEPLARRQALARLLPNVLFFAREGGLPARVFGVAADLVETVPCFDLSFRPDPGFWEAIDDA
jgi:hypothetical protein